MPRFDVELKKAVSLATDGLPNPVATLSVPGKPPQRSQVARRTRNPSWHQLFTFTNVAPTDELTIQLADAVDPRFSPEPIGHVALQLADLPRGADCWLSIEGCPGAQLCLQLMVLSGDSTPQSTASHSVTHPHSRTEAEAATPASAHSQQQQHSQPADSAEQQQQLKLDNTALHLELKRQKQQLGILQQQNSSFKEQVDELTADRGRLRELLGAAEQLSSERAAECTSFKSSMRAHADEAFSCRKQKEAVQMRCIELEDAAEAAINKRSEAERAIQVELVISKEQHDGMVRLEQHNERLQRQVAEMQQQLAQQHVPQVVDVVQPTIEQLCSYEFVMNEQVDE